MGWGQKWGSGQYGLDELRQRFNLQYSKELENQANARGGGAMYNEAGDIWGKNKAGERVYLGRAKGLYGNDELIQAHSRQAHPDEHDHSSDGSELSSIGDRAGALWNVWDGGGGGAKKEGYKPSDPTPELLDARKEWDRYQPGGDMNPDGLAGSIQFNPGGSGNGGGSGVQAAADYGNKATDDYSKRFLPQMKAQADLEALEIGRAGGDAVRKFEGEPPKLGDPKDLFNFYSKKINSAVE